MVRIAFPVATIAFWGPRRRARAGSGAEGALARAGDGGGDVAEGGGQPGVALGAALVLALAGRLTRKSHGVWAGGSVGAAPRRRAVWGAVVADGGWGQAAWASMTAWPSRMVIF